MATKSIITRIKNKVDTLSAWQSYTGTLLDGEIAVVRVPTGSSYTNPVTGKSEPVVELLMKVGDGTTAFANLPWLSAKASDVYDWAKAQTVEFNGTDSKIYFKSSAGTTVASVDLSSISSKITALESGKLSDITVSQSGSGVVKSVEKNGTGGIKVTRATVATGDIAGSAVTTAKIADANVTTAKIADSAVTNAKVAAGISSDKINVDSSTTLTSKLGTMDATIAANTAKLTGHTDDAINSMIDTKINAIDVSDSGTGYVTKVTQTNGKIAVTKSALPTASTSTPGIAKLGATGGAATYDSIFGTDGKGGINAQVNTNTADITNLKSAVAGGVHFRGTVTAKPTAASVTVNGSTTITAAAGDIVLWSAEGIEYIYTGSAWEELGDVTRLGELETKINNLDVTTTNAVATTHKFVSQVTQTDGKVAVTYTQPTSADVSHDDSTVKAALESLAANKSDNHDHPYLSNTVKYAGSSSAGGAATSANKVNSALTFNNGGQGVASGTTFDGSTARTISYNTIGAAAASHSHDDKYYTESEVDAKLLEKADVHDHPYAASSHAHGNITNSGTITSTAVTSATGVLVYDSNNKIQRATAAQARSIIGAGTSSLTIGTTSTTAAAGNHTHSGYEADITAIEGNYVRVNASNQLVHSVNGADTEIIFDCGGAN